MFASPSFAVPASPRHRRTTRRVSFVVLASAFALASAIQPVAAEAQAARTSPTAALLGLAFTDISAQAGVELPGVMTESCAWADFDNDGDPDLYLTSKGANLLLRNDGPAGFTDVTASAGVGDPGWGVGTAFGDLDNDGDLDLYVANHLEADVLYRNDGPVGPAGAFVFTDVSASAGVSVVHKGRGLAFLDYDRDGLLDIYVTSIGDFKLYHNLGGLQFQDVAAALGVTANSAGVGIVCTDIDDDGWLDIYTGNRSNDPSSLFLNQGGTFINIAAPAGVDAASLGMGVLSFDYDNDLDFDLYWTTFPSLPLVPNALFENINGATFIDVAGPSGTADIGGFGISCNAADVDNDGWEDFFVTNGFSPSTTPNVLFRNNGDKTFTDITGMLGGAAFDGRGVAFADFDGDGDMDLCVTGGPNDTSHLWRNDSATANHWIRLHLRGTQSNRSAVGARVEVATATRTIVKEVSGGIGRGNQNDLPLGFGLGADSTAVQVTIRWPNGLTQPAGGFAADATYDITEPAAVPVLLSEFSLRPEAGAVLIRWCLADASARAEFRLTALSRDIAWPIPFERVSETRYESLDRSAHLQPGAEVAYTLRAREGDGPWDLVARRTISVPAGRLRLAPAHPNPFNPETTIAFELDRSAPVDLVVFDATGRPVRRLLTGVSYPAGIHEITWDGRNDGGGHVPSATYFVRLTAGGKQRTQRVTLIK